MFRALLLLLSIFMIPRTSAVHAYHICHHSGEYDGYHRNHDHRRTSAQYQYPVYVPIIVRPVPIFINNPPSVSVIPVVHQTPVPVVTDPSKLPAKPSTPAGKLKSLEYQARGDEKLRKQLWAQAYVQYRNAADSANDRGEAHFRLGFVYTAMQYYPSAIREFKRGLFLSPELASSGIQLPMLFGPNSDILRTSIILKVIDWVREDANDSDRLFLLGLLLHFEGDSRRSQVLRSALSISQGHTDHIRVLLAQSDLPMVPGAKKLLIDLPPLPQELNPIPNAPVIPNWKHAPAGNAPVPQPPPPISLPLLLDKPIPIVPR